MLLVNQLQATTVRLFTPGRGVWFADCDLVLDESGIVPFGPCLLTIGTSILKGTIDPAASGSFAKSARVRVLAGGGGWAKDVLPLDFSNPAGALLTTAVYSATGAEVLEVVVDPVPLPLGAHFVRMGGRASAVFDRPSPVEWYVNAAGVTMVAPRLPVPFDPLSTEILSWDPLTRIAELASDTPIMPGTILLDPLRFDGALVVRDVDQTWGDGAARATCWCAESVTGSRLASALTALVVEEAGIAYLKQYEYRVVLQEPLTGGLILQIIDPLSPAPCALPIDLRLGIPGATAKLLPGAQVSVVFLGGDPSRPVAVGFKGGSASLGLKLATDGIGVAGHAISAEQVLGLFAQYTAALALPAVGGWGIAFQAAFMAAPQTVTAAILAAMVAGAVSPAPFGPLPGGILDLLFPLPGGFAAVMAGALAVQLPDPASAGLPAPVIPGLARKGLEI